MALASFAPSAAAALSAGLTSANVLLPTTGAPTIALVTNVGSVPAFVLLGSSSAVAVTTATGLVIMPGASVALTIGANTYLALIAGSYGIANVSISVGS